MNILVLPTKYRPGRQFVLLQRELHSGLVLTHVELYLAARSWRRVLTEQPAFGDRITTFESVRSWFVGGVWDEKLIVETNNDTAADSDLVNDLVSLLQEYEGTGVPFFAASPLRQDPAGLVVGHLLQSQPI
ncbi:hypothetical protein KY386_01235 [Candidatus Parcubacteria bacterium]|nr:hypothetical protein [Candidatus Parcubacteria bacterium]